MAKTKYDFIRELLESKKLKQNQREKIFELASREISLDGTLEERVKKIEKIIFNQEVYNYIHEVVDESAVNVQHSNNTEENKRSSQPTHINPYYLYRFLFEYNQNRVLRSTCHDIDSNELHKINEYCETDTYCFSKHLEKIIENYEKHEEKYFAPYQIKAIIRGYLTGKNYKGEEIKGWSSKSIEINWSSPQLKKWTAEHPNTPPNCSKKLASKNEIKLMPINHFHSAISYESIQNFTEVVLHFKNCFHIKSDDQSLRAILQRVNKEKNWDKQVKIEFSLEDFLDNLELFTDVDKLIQAYNILIELIIEQHNNDTIPVVRLKFYEENDNISFSIHHLNTRYKKTIDNVLNRPYGQTYRNLIDNQINGLCNLRLRADFGNEQFAEINLWDGKKLSNKAIELFEGVEHILEFTKKNK